MERLLDTYFYFIVQKRIQSRRQYSTLGGEKENIASVLRGKALELDWIFIGGINGLFSFTENGSYGLRHGRQILYQQVTYSSEK